MSNIKKHSLLIVMAMLILLVIPMSFAADVDGDATVQATDVSVDDVGINDVDEIQTSDELEYDTLQYSDDSDVLTDTYDYETYVTDPASSSVDYTKGDDTVKISVKTTYNYNTMSQLSNSKMYAYINGATDGIIVKSTWNTDVYGSAATFSFYLTQFDDYLTDGTNTIIFHPDEVYYDYCDPTIDTYNYQPLIVTIGGATPALTGVYIDALSGSGGSGTSDDPYHSLSDAYANAADGVIIFKEGTYNFYDLYNPFTLNKDMEFVADGAVYFTSVNNNMFTVSGSSTTTTFRGINFVNATSSKGTIVWALNGIHGALNFIDCNFLNNTGNCLIYSSCAVNMERCNFIDNTLKGTGTTGNYGSGMVFFYESDAANIQYCNFIGNKISAPNQAMVIDWDQQGTIDFENNYVYGTTTQLSNAMIGNTNGAITNGNYVVISAVNPIGVAAGDEPDLEVKFVKMADGSDVGANMANLTVALVPTVNAVASPITISENSGKAKYTATDIANNETINVTVNNHVLTAFDFAVSEAPDTTIYLDALAGTGGSGTSDDPYHNLDTALANVEDGGVIKFKEGTYNFYNELYTTKSLSQNVVFDADGEVNFTGGNAIFSIASVCTVTFNNINIVNMDTTTATIVNAKTSTKGTLNFNDCNFINNKAKTLIYSSCAVNFERCNFIDNVLSGTSTSTGGGIVFFYYSNNAVFKHCNFIGNEISAPNGVLIYDWDKDGTIDFEYNYIYGLTSPLANSALGNTNGAITNDNYVVISPVNPSDVTVGDEVDLVVNFVKMADGSAVGADMANLTVTYVPASENTVESPITISENTGSAKYTATDAVETETVDVKVNDHVLTTFEFTVAGAALADPELSVPETLDVEVGATANIGATQAGDGAISYVSSNESVATVADGVVTGVSEGTATITVSVAETAAYAADSKNVTVTVTAPVIDDAIYVDGFDNGDGGSGTSADPYHSLKKVIYTDASTNTGKEIKLLPGTYNFAGTTINLYNYDFTLTAADEGVVFTSTKALFQKNRPGSLTVNGIEFSGITSSEAAVYRSTSYSGDAGTVTFNNCTFINNKGTTLIQNTGNLNIVGCTFINNQATGVGSYSACGLINNYDGSANTIDISYSIFINNQIAFNDNQPIVMDSSNTPLPTVNFNYNFVNNNTALTDDQIAYHATITSTDYTIITVTAPSDVHTEDTVDLTVNFTKSDGSALAGNMPTLTVDLVTTKAAATIPVTITNNGGKGQYTAKSGGSYTEEGSVKYGDNVLVTFAFDVEGEGLPSPELTVPEELTVEIGETAEIGATQVGDGVISYASSDDSVATVDENGIVTGVSAGTATITVSVAETENYAAASAEVAVTVNKLDPNLVVPENLDIKVGGTADIGAVWNGEGQITYTPADSSVATVDDNGVVTAGNTAGTSTTIAVTVAPNGDYDGATKTVTVNVKKDPEVVLVNGDQVTITVGETVKLAGVYWALALDCEIANTTVASALGNNGKVTGEAVGTTTVTFTNTYNAEYATESVTVYLTVIPAPVSPNLVVPETLEVTAGETVEIGATQDGTGEISYTSNDTTVATVSADGIVTGVKGGIANITVSVAAAEGYLAESKNVIVTVNKKPTEIVVTSDSITLAYGEKLETGDYGDWVAAIKSNGETVWYDPVITIADPSIVVYNDDDYYYTYFEGLKVGTTTANVSFAGDETYAPSYKIIDIEVVPAEASVAVESDSLELNVGDSSSVVATTTPEGLAVTFVSNDTSVATVDADGNVVAVGAGSATITVAVNDTNYAADPAVVTVTVTNAPVNTILTGEDLVMDYKDGAWAVTLTDADGNAISDAIVKIGIKINGVDKVYNRKTDANGVASLPINSAPGEYAVNATFDGDDIYAGSFAEATVTVNPIATVLSGDNLEMGYKDGEWTVTLTDADGNAISGVVVKIGININGADKVYNRKTDGDGVANLPINMAPGEYAINATFEGTSKYAAAFVNATVTVNKAALTISAEDLTMGYKDGSSYKVNVVDANGDAVANVKVKFTIKGKDYNIKTDNNGVAELPINLGLGEYTVTATVNDAIYESNEISNAVTVTADNLAITASDLNMTYGDGSAYEVQLVDGNGNPVAIANQIIKVTIKGKTYDRKTDANGIAKLPIKLAAGNYTITAEYNGIELTNNVTVVKA